MTVLAQCCCGYSLKKGTIIIAILYMTWSIVEIAVTANRLHTLRCYNGTNTATGNNDRLSHKLNNYSGRSGEDGSSMSAHFMLTKDLVLATRALLIVGLILAIIQAICGGLLLFGAIQEIPEILFGWVVVETLVAIASAVIDIITCIAVITEGTLAGSIIGIVFGMLYVVFSVHFLRVVYDYYQTLREHPKFYLFGKETGERATTEV